MDIPLTQLEAVIGRLIKHVRDSGLEHILLNKDYYWNIPSEQLQELGTAPTEFDVGKLSDDWSELQKLLESNRAPHRHHLIWLAAILRAIGDNTVL